MRKFLCRLLGCQKEQKPLEPPPPLLSTGDGNKLYEQLRDYVKHEDNLINNRMTWLITAQSFLLATYGFSFQKRFEIVTKPLVDKDFKPNPEMFEYQIFQFDILFLVIAIVGFLTSFVADNSIGDAQASIQLLNKKWEDLPKGNNLTLRYLPSIIGKNKPRRFTLPVLFIATWIVIAGVTVYFFRLDDKHMNKVLLEVERKITFSPPVQQQPALDQGVCADGASQRSPK